MDRQQFGRLLATLRKSQFDPSEGRVWTQQMLADHAQVSFRTIGELERGDKAILDGQSLYRISRALNLNMTEQKKFISLASEIDVQRDLDAADLRQMLRSTIELFHSFAVPSVVHNSLYEAIAMNASYLKLHRITPKWFESLSGHPLQYNLLRLIFQEGAPIRTVVGERTELLFSAGVNYFRSRSLPHRHTDQFRTIFRELNKYREFRLAWSTAEHFSQDVRTIRRSFAYEHVDFGHISYFVSGIEMPIGTGDLTISIISPTSPHTLDVLQQLCKEGGSVWDRTQLPTFEIDQDTLVKAVGVS